MRPIQNAEGHVGLTARNYPIEKTTVVTSGQVVTLQDGKIVPAAAAQTGAIAGIAGEDHSGETDVLNGIAQDPATGKIYLTGKYWPRLYEVRLVPVK